MEVARQKYNTVPLSRAARKYSQAGINRKRKLESAPAASAAGPAGAAARLHDFFTTLNKRKKTTPAEALAKHQQMVRASARKQQMMLMLNGGGGGGGGQQQQQQQQQAAAAAAAAVAAAAAAATAEPPPAPPPPSSTDVSKFARAIHRRKDVNDMTPHTVEEYVLETAEKGAHRVYHTRLTIFQRAANEEYLGELYVERDYRENDNKGSTCRFTLGTR